MESEEQHNKIKELEARVEMLELFSHPPIDWQKRIESLEDSYIRLYDLFKQTMKEIKK